VLFKFGIHSLTPKDPNPFQMNGIAGSNLIGIDWDSIGVLPPLEYTWTFVGDFPVIFVCHCHLAEVLIFAWQFQGSMGLVFLRRMYHEVHFIIVGNLPVPWIVWEIHHMPFHTWILLMIVAIW